MFSLTLELQKVGNPPRMGDDCVGESIAQPAQELQVYPYGVGVARIILEHIFFKNHRSGYHTSGGDVTWSGCPVLVGGKTQ